MRQQTTPNEKKDTSRQDRDRKTTQKPHTKAPHPVSNITEILSEFGNLEPLQSSQSIARTIVLYCAHPWQAPNLRISSFYHFSLVQFFLMWPCRRNRHFCKCAMDVLSS